MTMVRLGEDNFKETIENSGVVLVDCWADWCGACKTFSPLFEKVALRHPEHVFGTLDTQAESELVASLGVRHIPSLLVYRDGVLLLNKPGSFDEPALEDVVSQAVELDMDAVRTDIASSEAKQGKGNELVV